MLVQRVLAGTLVRKRYERIKDVHANNCEVAVLHGASSSILSKKYKFHRFHSILIPFGLPLLGAAVGLLRYGKRGDLVHAGRTSIRVGERDAVYLVFNVANHPREFRRQYAPATWSPLEIVQSISDLDSVVLRGADKIAAGQHSGDIDILIASHDLHLLKKRFDARIGTHPIDVYTEDGSEGHTHNGAPYYAPDVAKRILNSAVLDGAGIKVCSGDWQFISYCYHLLFHGKLNVGAEKKPLTLQSFRKAGGLEELKSSRLSRGKTTSALG